MDCATQKVALLAAVALIAALIARPAGAQEPSSTENPLPTVSNQVSSSLMWWTSFEDYQIAAPLAFNTLVYEATISAHHTSFDFLSGTVAGWSDPENNGAWTGSWSLQSIGFEWDGWALRTTRWTHIINPSVSAADLTGTFIARQFQIEWGELHAGIELGVGGVSGYSQSIWGQATLPATAAEGVATIIYSVSPTLQIGYKEMDWVTGSAPCTGRGVFWNITKIFRSVGAL